MDNYTSVLEISKQIITYSILNSLIVYGLLIAIKDFKTKTNNQTGEDDVSDISTKVKAVVSFIVGYFWFPVLNINVSQDYWYNFGAKAALGAIIGVVSIAVYKVAIKGMLETIPVIFESIQTLIRNKLGGGQTNLFTQNNTPQVPVDSTTQKLNEVIGNLESTLGKK